MKKTFIISISVLFIAVSVSSCKSNAPHCQAYSTTKIVKEKVDRTERSI